MPNLPNRADLVRVLFAVLSVVLTWQGRVILSRIDTLESQVHTLEANQIKILTTLGVVPYTTDTQKIGVSSPFSTPPAGNHGNQKNQNQGKKGYGHPGQTEGIVVWHEVELRCP